MIPEFLQKGQPIQFLPGDTIYDEGQLLEKSPIYFLLDGEVEIVKRYVPLKQEKFPVAKGHLFGLVEVYAGTPRQTTARAITRSQVIAFTGPDFEEATRSHLNLAILAIKNLSGMLRAANAHVRELK